MWFFLALICLLSWGGADLFYKKGTNEEDKYSHLKIAVCVGLVMGVCSAALLIFTDAGFSLVNLVKYTPASVLYILSMVIGYAGLRYLEVSIISPVQNSSGALSAVVMIIWFTATGHVGEIKESFDVLSIIGTLLICVGVVSLAVVEKKLSSGAISDKKYRLGAKALIFPLLYCVFDTLGTAADGIFLDEESGLQMSELDVLIAYGLTFFFVGVCCEIYLLLKKQRFNPFKSGNQLTASCFECFGQVFYVYAMAANPVVAAPMISAYCIVSVVLSRIFLKEKLNAAQNTVIAVVIAGIVLLGIAEA